LQCDNGVLDRHGVHSLWSPPGPQLKQRGEPLSRQP
jgi:hypothetical protein